MNTRLKEVRKALGMTLQEMGTRFGVTRFRIANLESGHDKPGEGFIYRFCHELNVNRSWLETGEGEMFNPPATPAPVTTDALRKQFWSEIFASLPTEQLVDIISAATETLKQRAGTGN